MALLAQIVYAERPLTDNNRSLASYGLKDGDVVILRQKETVEPRPSMRFPGERGSVPALPEPAEIHPDLASPSSCQCPLAPSVQSTEGGSVAGMSQGGLVNDPEGV